MRYLLSPGVGGRVDVEIGDAEDAVIASADVAAHRGRGAEGAGGAGGVHADERGREPVEEGGRAGRPLHLGDQQRLHERPRSRGGRRQVEVARDRRLRGFRPGALLSRGGATPARGARPRAGLRRRPHVRRHRGVQSNRVSARSSDRRAKLETTGRALRMMSLRHGFLTVGSGF